MPILVPFSTPMLGLRRSCSMSRQYSFWLSCVLRTVDFQRSAELVAIIMAIAGTFIIATHGQVTELAITPIGLFWGLFSAVTYALYILLPAKAIEKWGSLIVIGLGMLLGGLVFPIAIQAWKYKLPLTGGNLLALFGLIFIGTVFAYTVFLKGTAMVGAVKGSLLASVEPVALVILTVLIMGDRFFAIDVVGMYFNCSCCHHHIA